MQFLISLDCYGSFLHWYVNHQKKVYTRLGGILTIISSSICISILIFLLNELVIRNNPNITENDESNYEFKKIKFNEQKILIPWTISDYNIRKVNFTEWIFPVIYYFYGERDKKTGELPYDYKILNYTYCNETYLEGINYFQDAYIDFSSLYCIEMDDLIMGGDWFHDFVYHIQMDFYLCEDGVNMGTEGKKCTDYDKLVEYIGVDNAWHIEIYYPEIQFKPKDKNNPLEIFYNIHFYNFNKLNTKVDRLYLKEFQLIDDQGWVFTNEKNYTLWGFDNMKSESYSRSDDGKDFITDFSSSKIYSLVIYLNRNSKIFTREYPKLLDAIGNLLSIINGVFVFFKYFSQFFTEAYQDREIVNNVFIQKYFMAEKYNLYNRSLIKFNKMDKLQICSENLGYITFHTKEKDKISIKKSQTVKCDNFSIQKNNVSKGLVSKASKFENNKNSKFYKKTFKPKNLSENHHNNIESSLADFNIINKDNSANVLGLAQKNIYCLNNNNDSYIDNEINKIDLVQIQKYMRKSCQANDSKKNNIKFNDVNKHQPADFKFPYYLYLLNIFNKIFAIKRCCVNQKFQNAWKYLIDVFDVTKFIQLQTNMDLINKIIFKMKSEDKEMNSKFSNIRRTEEKFKSRKNYKDLKLS